MNKKNKKINLEHCSKEQINFYKDFHYLFNPNNKSHPYEYSVKDLLDRLKKLNFIPFTLGKKKSFFHPLGLIIQPNIPRYYKENLDYLVEGGSVFFVAASLIDIPSRSHELFKQQYSGSSFFSSLGVGCVEGVFQFNFRSHHEHFHTRIEKLLSTSYILSQVPIEGLHKISLFSNTPDYLTDILQDIGELPLEVKSYFQTQELIPILERKRENLSAFFKETGNLNNWLLSIGDEANYCLETLKLSSVEQEVVSLKNKNKL